MIVINNKWKYNGTKTEMAELYSIYPECMCELTIFEAPECYVNAVFPDLPEL